jgi:hypothetical protein
LQYALRCPLGRSQAPQSACSCTECGLARLLLIGDRRTPMSKPIRVAHEALPRSATAQIRRFLFAYYLPEQDRYVIRHVSPTTSEPEELEFDAQYERFVSREERVISAAGRAEQVYAAQDLVAWATYSITPRRNALTMHIDIYRSGQGSTFTWVDQELYAPIPWDVASLVTRATEKAEFPRVLASQTARQRVGYWAYALHRLRRANGEDSAFGPDLLYAMERTDPTVRGILSRILSLVAELEQADPTELKRRFEARAGVQVE